jgi:hypothetical protein
VKLESATMPTEDEDDKPTERGAPERGAGPAAPVPEPPPKPSKKKKKKA